MAYNFLIKRPYLNIYYKHTTIRDVFDFVISSIIPNDEQNPIIYDVMMMYQYKASWWCHHLGDLNSRLLTYTIRNIKPMDSKF